MNETDKINIGENVTFHIKTNMNCRTRNVLYMIECNGCKAKYIGKTHTALQDRVRVHKQQINNPQYRQLGMSKHIDDCCGNTPKFNITPFFKISDNKSMGCTKEKYFIEKFKPMLNNLRL